MNTEDIVTCDCGVLLNIRYLKGKKTKQGYEKYCPVCKAQVFNFNGMG